MKRRHLFEFEDLPWFPERIRNYITEFLCTIAEKFNMFGPVVPTINELIAKSENPIVVDLASGGGGQWRGLIPQVLLSCDDFHLFLTDKYPNTVALRKVQEGFPSVVSIEEESVDATGCISEKLVGVRTLFLSLHHFKPELVEQVFASAIEANVPIAVFEAQQRDVKHLIRFSLSPILVWALTPFIRPFSIGRLVLTYLIPIVPLVILWDGLVSVLRTYTPEEIKMIAKTADAEEKFIWESEVIDHGQQKIQIFKGYPKL